jgi:hypothetical protein
MHATTLARKEEEEKKIEKENPPTNTQTHREPLDGWMD